MENIDLGQKGSNDSDINLSEIWETIKKNARPILLSFFAVTFLTGLVTFFFIPKQYQSYVTFYIQEKKANSMLSVLSSQLPGGLGAGVPGLDDGTNADLCGEIIQAPSFLKTVLSEEKQPCNWKDVEKFSKTVKVEKKKPSEAVKVSVLSKKPELSYQLTTRIFLDYKRFVDEQINHNNSKTRRFIESQYNIAERRLESAENRLRDYQKSNKVPILPETMTLAINNFADLEQQRVSTQISLNDAKQRLQEASHILDKKAPAVKESISDSVNQALVNYKAKASEVEIELAKARQTYTDEHPVIKALLKQKAELERQIKAESKSLNSPAIASNYMSGLVEVAGLEARLSSLNKVYNGFYPQVKLLPDTMLTYADLVREQKVSEQIYIMLSSQLEEAKISEAKEDNVVIQVIQPPLIPYKKYSPSTVMNMVVVGILMLFAGVFIAVFKEKLF